MSIPKVWVERRDGTADSAEVVSLAHLTATGQQDTEPKIVFALFTPVQLRHFVILQSARLRSFCHHQLRQVLDYTPTQYRLIVGRVRGKEAIVADRRALTRQAEPARPARQGWRSRPPPRRRTPVKDPHPSTLGRSDPLAPG
jgi:hypothetical protein